MSRFARIRQQLGLVADGIALSLHPGAREAAENAAAEQRLRDMAYALGLTDEQADSAVEEAIDRFQQSANIWYSLVDAYDHVSRELPQRVLKEAGR